MNSFHSTHRLAATMLMAASFVAMGIAQENMRQGGHATPSRIAIRFASNLPDQVVEYLAEDGSAASATPAPGDCFGSFSSQECPSQALVGKISQTASVHDVVRVRIEGQGDLSSVVVHRNAHQIFDFEHVTLPFEFLVGASGEEGSLRVTIETRNGQYRDAALTVVAAAKGGSPAQLSASNFRFFTNVAEEGNWEVITGLGNGGRLLRTSNQCMLPWLSLQACPANLILFGITDRARRGESVNTLVNAQGTATRLGVMINGRLRGEWQNVGLPTLVPQRVSLNPMDDNVIVFAVVNGIYVERRLPIGTRPF